MVAAIDDLVPVRAAPVAPRLKMDGGDIVAVVVDAGGRMHRLRLSADQAATLAGDVVRIALTRVDGARNGLPNRENKADGLTEIQ